MKRRCYTKYYRVFKHDTAITEISTNDFRKMPLPSASAFLYTGHPVDVLCSIPNCSYSLPPDEEMFYGYATRVRAMEKAKAGALAYIAWMIKCVEAGIGQLKKYRADHFEDLNVTLLEASIRKLEREMYIK